MHGRNFMDMIGDDLHASNTGTKVQLLSLRYPRLSATGSGKHTAVELALVRLSANVRNEQIFGQVPQGVGHSE